MANKQNASQRCYICDVELIPIPRGHVGRLLDNHATRDHVPPDGLFCDPKPSDLITVPCCHKHNRKHSGVDERLRMLAALEIGRNEGGEKILLEKVFGSTFKKLRQPKFVTQIASTMRNEVVVTEQGAMPVAIFSVDVKEILDCVADITRGLLKHFYPQFNYHGHDFMVVDIHSATLAKGQREAQLRLISEMASKTKEDVRGNQHEFRFWRQIDEQREHGAWLLVFYETVAFTVSHSRIPFKALFDAKTIEESIGSPRIRCYFLHMPKVKVSTLKQSPYGFVSNGERVDPTRQGVQKAIDEGRFSTKIMDRDYNDVAAEIGKKTQDPAEMNRLMHEFHNERIAELVRTKSTWLDKTDAWPIKINQFNQIVEGNHRFRAIRYLELTEVEVVVVQEAKPRPEYALPEIW